MAGSEDESTFSFLRNLHTDFHSGCTRLHSHQRYLRVPFSLRPHQYLFLFVFLMIASLAGVRCNLCVVFICIFFMFKDVEHCLIYLLVICISSESCLFSSFAHLLIWLFVLLLSSF
jgi:hypothetical protein